MEKVSPGSLRFRIMFLSFAILLGCKDSDKDDDASTTDASTTDGAVNSPCGRMCSNFRELECIEGNDFYDSDRPGPVGIPNITCEEFCESQMAMGVNLNTACAAKAPTCEEIETYRSMQSCD